MADAVLVGEQNPDFGWQPKHETVANTIPAEIREMPWVRRLLTYLGDRDHQAEDYFNRQVLRRAVSARVLGDGTTRTGTAWQLVAPSCAVSFYKAQPESHLTCFVSAAGEYADLGFPSWVEFGVRITEENPGGGTAFSQDYAVARRLVGMATEQGQWSGSADCASVLPKTDANEMRPGQYTVAVIVRGQNAGTTWQSEANSSISLTVIESM
jgi:hypothetical protein